MVQLECVVSSTGDNAGQDNNVRVAVVDDTTQDTMDKGKNWEKIECSINSISTLAWKEFASKEGSDDQHGYEGEGVEDEDHGEQGVNCLLCAIQLGLVIWCWVMEQCVPISQAGYTTGVEGELSKWLGYD